MRRKYKLNAADWQLQAGWWLRWIRQGSCKKTAYCHAVFGYQSGVFPACMRSANH
jgi:hypothetical protein